jgi:transposase
MTLYVGDDWAEDHHDVHLMNEAGARLAARRLPEGVTGVTALHGLVAEHASGPDEVVVGIETDRGPWVSALVAAGYHVYAVNPRSAARYRERHHTGGGKSDAGDAKVLADLVRTDRHNHREVAGDSDEAGAVRILARAHQQLVWDRNRQTNRLRNALREYFPAALQAFPGLAHGDALGVLARAPGPREAARLSTAKIRGAAQRRP